MSKEFFDREQIATRQLYQLGILQFKVIQLIRILPLFVQPEDDSSLVIGR